MEIKQMAVEALIPYPKNTKQHDQVQIDNVAESIRQYGFVQPIVIDKNNEVVIGHCRLLAAKQLGLDEVPCVRVDDLTEEQVKALRIVDNKTNESPWELDFLADELEEIDLSAFNFDFGIYADNGSHEVVEVPVPEVNEDEEPTAKTGDIYQLGAHRLMCGDSTRSDMFENLLGGGAGRLRMHRSSVQYGL